MSDPNPTQQERLFTAIAARFGAESAPPRSAFDRAAAEPLGLDELVRMLEHSSHRRWTERPVDQTLLRILFAAALSAPSKSDLQQADIIHVADRLKVQALADLIPDMPWISQAPVVLVFCGNNRRIRQIGEWRGKPFVNDHLDHFMNAAVDAGIVMAQFIRAAEAVGLGVVPISAMRNHSAATSEILGLPDAVFPVAGLCVGYPVESGRIIPRLSMEVTVHTDVFSEEGVQEHIDAYDQRRHAQFPLRRQRYPDLYPDASFNGWSEDKARHYSVPERADFGDFNRKKKFSLR
jgi:nitroreductase/FMN reductase [NAD(P)H]